MKLTAADARRWLDNFEAADRADIQERRLEGPQPARAIALSLSLLRAAHLAAGGRLPVDPRRQAQEEAVRIVWETLRSRSRQ
jgi:hypothetical protein